jgi:hypothetical protein
LPSMTEPLGHRCSMESPLQAADVARLATGIAHCSAPDEAISPIGIGTDETASGTAGIRRPRSRSRGGPAGLPCARPAAGSGHPVAGPLVRPARPYSSPTTTRGSRGFRGDVRSRAAAIGSSARMSSRSTRRPSIPAGRPPMNCSGHTRTNCGGSCTGSRRRRPQNGRRQRSHHPPSVAMTMAAAAPPTPKCATPRALCERPNVCLTD